MNLKWGCQQFLTKPSTVISEMKFLKPFTKHNCWELTTTVDSFHLTTMTECHRCNYENIPLSIVSVIIAKWKKLGTTATSNKIPEGSGVNMLRGTKCNFQISPQLNPKDSLCNQLEQRSSPLVQHRCPTSQMHLLKTGKKSPYIWIVKSTEHWKNKYYSWQSLEVNKLSPALASCSFNFR